TAVRIVAVAVPAHGVAAVAIEVREHGVEGEAGRRLDRGSDRLEPLRERLRGMYDARVAVADRTVHRDQPRHRRPPAEDGELLLLPGELRRETREMERARRRV